MKSTIFYSAPVPLKAPLGILGASGLIYAVGYAFRDTPSVIYRATAIRFMSFVIMALGAVTFLFWLIGLVRKPSPEIQLDSEGIRIRSKPTILWPNVTDAWVQVTEDGRRTYYTLVVEAKGLAKPGGLGQGLGTQKIGVNDLLESTSKRHASPEAILAAISAGFLIANGRPIPQRRMQRLVERY